MKKTLLASFVVLSLLASPLSVLAWAEPSDSPPDGNVGAPIHIGAQAQTKAGALTILGDTSAATKGFMVGSSGLILQNATQNLIYGNVDAASQGNLLNLQIENSSKFIVDKDGKVSLFANSTPPNVSPNLDIRGGNGVISLQRDGGDSARIYLKRASSGINYSLGMVNFFGYDSNNNDTLMSYIRGYTVSPTDGAETGGISFHTINNGGAIIQPMTIKGNAVGIGTIDPVASLDMGATGGIRLGGVTRTTWPASGVGGSGADNYLARWNGAGAIETSTIYQRDGGNIGLGTILPNSKLEARNGNPAGEIQFGYGEAVITAYSFAGANGPAIQGIATNNSNLGTGVFGFTSKANGKAIHGYSNSATAYAGYFDGVSGRNYFANTVGIGNLNPNPAYKLDVTGDVNITGSYRVNGAPIATGGGTEWATSGNDIYNANTGDVIANGRIQHTLGIISTGVGNGSIVGNARGVGANDLQTYRQNPDEVASGQYATIGGGQYNKASGQFSTVAGGRSATASETYATVGGGQYNSALAYSSTVPGGYSNTASGEYSFAAGLRAKAVNNGTFALSDSQNADFNVNSDDVFGARFNGGYWLTGGNVGIGNSNANSKLQISGSMSLPIVTKTSEYTLTSSDYTVIGNTSATGVDFNLPSAVGITGRIYVIKRIGANSVVIYPNGSETIDGESPALELEVNYEVVTIQSNGANWIELSHSHY